VITGGKKRPPVPLGDGGALQHVLADGHRLAQILLGPAALEDRPEEVDDSVRRQPIDVRLHSAASASRIMA
jgi:hypothetical protein